MRHPARNGRRAQRQTEAEARQAEYASLSKDEKVKRALKARGFSRRQLLRLGVDLSDPNVKLPA